MSISVLNPPKAAAILQQLDSGGTLEVKWNAETNTPSKITGNLSQPTNHSPEWIAYEFLKKSRTLYGLRDPEHTMKVVEVERHPDKINVHYQHLLFGTPVWEDKLVIEISNQGVIQRIEGTIHPHLEKQLFNRPMHSAITKKQAIQTAIAAAQSEIANKPIAEYYYLPTRPGVPLIYIVRLQYINSNQSTTTLIHSLTGRIIEQ
ncbi:hypothetical protein GJB61_24870 [Paenibacillus sp. LC-T2]|uniref:Uncharacterized protein n=2 Tax=Paenibacillus monticola TaxID=2666075 RepID=A0A7X2H9Y1_9BACL|nr:hypothetical protein [Paenibacillus monticola]